MLLRTPVGETAISARDLHCVPWMCTLGVTEILIDVLAFLPNGNGPYASVMDYKKCLPSVQAVSQFSLSQASRGFGVCYRGLTAFLAHSTCLTTAKLRKLILIEEVRSYNRALKFTCFFLSTVYMCGTGVPSSRCEELLFVFNFM